jgi:hypothetical protein
MEGPICGLSEQQKIADLLLPDSLPQHDEPAGR